MSQEIKRKQLNKNIWKKILRVFIIYPTTHNNNVCECLFDAIVAVANWELTTENN